MNVNTQVKLATLEVARSFTPADQGASTDTSYSWSLQMQEQVIIDLTSYAFPAVGSEVFEFKVIDANGNSDMVTITITTENNVSAYSGISLGSYNDPEGSFMATTDGTTYTKAEAFQHQELIDLVFYLGAQNGSTFAGPGDATVQDVFQLNVDPDKWTTFNDTRFIYPAPIGHAEFDAIGEAYIFPEFDDNDSESDANQLQSDDVVFFKTAGGKLGFLKINTITNRGDQVNFDVKVEK
jgi:hypothetical protein